MKRLPVQTPAMARKFLLGVVALAAMAWPAGGLAQGVNATVLSIGDGDTIRVRQAGKALTVRLACIDAPETAQSPYGQQARTYLQQRLPIGREVSLNLKTTDRYGRSVAEVISETNINLALVEDGQAFAYRQYLSGCDAKAYLEAEERASRALRGLAGKRRHHPAVGFPPRSPRSGHPRWHHPGGPPLPLQRDQLLCQSPGAATPRAQLSRRRWQWPRL